MSVVVRSFRCDPKDRAFLEFWITKGTMNHNGHDVETVLQNAKGVPLNALLVAPRVENSNQLLKDLRDLQPLLGVSG